VMEAAMEVLHALRPGFDIGLLVNFPSQPCHGNGRRVPPIRAIRLIRG
jgi:hypothetical protein